MLFVLLALTASASSGEWNVLDYGAVGDGQTDCTAPFQKALDAAAAAGGGTVLVPAGHYRINGVLSIPGAVTLKGTFHVPPTDQREGRPKLDGSVLLAFAGRGNPEGEPFIRLAGSMATIAGFTITYPEWREEDVPPVPYPPTIYANGVVNNGILDCLLLNSYEGIVLQDAARFLVRNVYGYPSKRGLYVDSCYDIGRVENCHFWPFGTVYDPKKPYAAWVNQNGVAFEFARTDWQYVTNTFCFGYGVGYKFSTSKTGSCNGNFVGIGADCCTRAVLVDTAPGAIDLLIVNGEFVGKWGSADSVGVEIVGKSTGRVSLTNCAFWGPLDRCIWQRALQGNVAATACGFLSWDEGGEDSPAVQIDGGKAILQGNSFDRDGLHVRVGDKVDSVILIGNQAGDGFNVENHAGKRTQMVANEAGLITWPRGSKRNYRVDIGAPGDSTFLRGFYGREGGGFWGEDATMRWGGVKPRLRLPVEKGKTYVMKLHLFMPEHAVAPDMGIYLGDIKLADLPSTRGIAEVVATIPPQKSDMVELQLRAKVWRPSEVEGTGDARALTVALRRVEMTSGRPQSKVYSANDGEWKQR
ncbi:MAG TPA: glycosyl hydrolase family 28-related protein [Candidatus Hydrogenedentes bacterium]|mgnify:CR=1 FL=1|nr:glycosyl hydrolase family 28-related protein [Candidatus Hydrogenedentota bacterium]HOL76852.1 glycosyl hydrolase family 28-related protein [Candidatus Hydrogenedentota bacterium]HPO86206.1 glycosyl hydrolase family 28-related protein [Candidatus Hydrogenedentota bacterium]